MSIFDDESDRSGYDRLANRVLRGMRGGSRSAAPARERRLTPKQAAGHNALARRMAQEFIRAGKPVPADLVCYTTSGGKRACFKPKGGPKKKARAKGRGRRR